MFSSSRNAQFLTLSFNSFWSLNAFIQSFTLSPDFPATEFDWNSQWCTDTFQFFNFLNSPASIPGTLMSGNFFGFALTYSLIHRCHNGIVIVEIVPTAAAGCTCRVLHPSQQHCCTRKSWISVRSLRLNQCYRMCVEFALFIPSKSSPSLSNSL